MDSFFFGARCGGKIILDAIAGGLLVGVSRGLNNSTRLLSWGWGGRAGRECGRGHIGSIFFDVRCGRKVIPGGTAGCGRGRNSARRLCVRGRTSGGLRTICKSGKVFFLKIIIYFSSPFFFIYTSAYIYIPSLLLPYQKRKNRTKERKKK